MLTMDGVWKKYSRDAIFHRSLREDLLNVFTRRFDNVLGVNDFWALSDISLSVAPGESVGLYGHNGAGKSTILKLLSGVTHPTLGSLNVRGRIAPLIEIGAGFHPDLTAKENIYMNGAILGMKIPEIKAKFDSIVDFSELSSFIQVPVKKYSSGMYLRLAFSIAIHSEADVYLIDEIISVGDTEFQDKCIDKIIELRFKGKTLIVISHSHDLMRRVTDRIIYLEKGEVVARD
ncbi:ABC transporter ATP-binding protein [Geobacter benzoatilyticus]|nr:ABC transporter ATP-binding protein [Geobacter benzoatilyticus]